MSDRSTKPWGNQRELNSDGLRALGSIERAVQTSSDQSYPRIESTLAPKHRYASTGLPEFDNLPSLSDENIGDVLQYLIAMVDAFEDHYADPLRRLREQYHEQERSDPHEQQHGWVNDSDDDYDF